MRRQEPFELVEVDITGDEELESRYREWIPVVEIDGRQAFVYHVDRDALLTRVRTKSDSGGSPPKEPSG